MHSDIKKLFESADIKVYDSDGCSICGLSRLEPSIFNALDGTVQCKGNRKYLRGKKYIFSCPSSESDSVLMLCDGLVDFGTEKIKAETLHDALQSLFKGNIEKAETVNYLQRFNIPVKNYVIIYTDSDLYEDIVGLYPIRDDIIVKLTSRGLAILHFCDEEESEDTRELVLALFDTVEQELGRSLDFGVSEQKLRLEELYDAFCEARRSIAIHKKLSYKGNCAFYGDMLLERIALNVPEDKRKSYCKKMFSNKRQKQISSELSKTIESFLEHDLNLGETAKHLYIHSNTLAYRIKKINKIFGMDIKSFNNANILKILLIMYKLDKIEGK